MGRVAGSRERAMSPISFDTTCPRKDGIKRSADACLGTLVLLTYLLWLTTNKGNA
jgi:hypothetical protein